jgi:diaminopimelate epimerase
LGNDFLVNTTTAGDQRGVSIAGLPDDRFVITYHAFSGDTDVYARIFNADGTPSGDDFLVNTTTDGDNSVTNVTALSDGRFVVVWRSSASGNYDIRGRIYNTDGTAAGDDFLINTSTGGDQFEAHISATPDGGFIVTWMSNEGGQFDIRARALRIRQR